MKTKISVLVILLLSVLCFVTACGGTKSEVPSGQDDTPAVSEEPTMSPTPTSTPTPTPTMGPTPYPQPGDSDFPCLYEKYQDYFSIGIGVVKYDK